MSPRATIPVQCSELGLAHGLPPLGCLRNHSKKFQDLIRFALPQWPELSSSTPMGMGLEIEFRFPKGDRGFWTPYIEFGKMQNFVEVCPEVFKPSDAYTKLPKKLFRCEHSYIFGLTPWLVTQGSGEGGNLPVGGVEVPDYASLFAQNQQELEKDMNDTLDLLGEWEGASEQTTESAIGAAQGHSSGSKVTTSQP